MSRHNRERRSWGRLDSGGPDRNDRSYGRVGSNGHGPVAPGPRPVKSAVEPIDRRQFLLANHDRAESGYVRAVEAGCREPVAVVIDSHDGLGKMLAGCLGDIAVTTNLFGRPQSRIRPAVLFVLERKDAIAAFEGATPLARKFLEMAPPPGMFHVMAVADGGLLSVFLPTPRA